MHVAPTAHAHHLEVDEILNVVDFLAQRDHLGLTVHEHVAQHFGKFQHTVGGVVVVGVNH